MSFLGIGPDREIQTERMLVRPIRGRICGAHTAVDQNVPYCPAARQKFSRCSPIYGSQSRMDLLVSAFHSILRTFGSTTFVSGTRRMFAAVPRTVILVLTPGRRRTGIVMLPRFGNVTTTLF